MWLNFWLAVFFRLTYLRWIFRQSRIFKMNSSWFFNDACHSMCHCVCMYRHLHLLCLTVLLLGRRNGSSGRASVYAWCFSRQPHLRGPSADRRETLPHDRNLSQKKQKIPKIWGLSPKKILGPKTCKMSVIFLQRPTLIANISGTA